MLPLLFRKIRFCTISAVFAFTLLPAAWAQTMRVHVIDVGQGAATLVEFPCAAILIDTGGESNGDFNSTDQLMQYLDDFFGRRPDLNRTFHSLVLTHPHIDHTRGVTSVLRQYRILNAITNGSTGRDSGSPGQIALQNKAAAGEDTQDTSDDIGFFAASVGAIAQNRGLTNSVIDPINCPTVDPKITVLWGRQEQNPGWNAAAFKNANNHSVVLRIDFGNASYLNTGDLQEQAIAGLLAHYRNSSLLDVDVYHVGHHGSYNATTDELLRAITPKIAAISMGDPDRQTTWTAWAYGHPRKVTVDLLERYVANSRDQTAVRVATAVKSFQSKQLRKAIYGTGWDGSFVLETKTDGTWQAIKSSATPTSSNLININSASAEDLTNLPTIGPGRAAAIVNYRQRNGFFSSIDQLGEVPGIGPATLTAIRALVTTGD